MSNQESGQSTKSDSEQILLETVQAYKGLALALRYIVVCESELSKAKQQIEYYQSRIIGAKQEVEQYREKLAELKKQYDDVRTFRQMLDDGDQDPNFFWYIPGLTEPKQSSVASSVAF
jgi:chromosome segregation ATPase